MARKRFTTEQIIGLLREAEVRLGQGQAIGTICRGIGISEQSYYRWRRDYGGLKLDQAKRLKDLEREKPFAEAGVRRARALAPADFGTPRVRCHATTACDAETTSQDA